jgi:hypothetical protein
MIATQKWFDDTLINEEHLRGVKFSCFVLNVGLPQLYDSVR